MHTSFKDNLLFIEQAKKEDTHNMALNWLYTALRYHVEKNVNATADLPTGLGAADRGRIFLFNSDDWPEWVPYKGWFMTWDGDEWRFSEPKKGQAFYNQALGIWLYTTAHGGSSWQVL